MRTHSALLLALSIATIAQAAEEVHEDWQLKGQATYIGQKLKSFRSSYGDKNSLNGDGDSSYTFTSRGLAGIHEKCPENCLPF